MITPLREQLTPMPTIGAARRAVPIKDLQQDDGVVTADGIRLGAMQGLYEAGPLGGRLLVQGPGDLPETTAVYAIPLRALALVDPATRSVHLFESAARARAQWLLDYVG